jgi:hypothetical protein
MLLYLCSIDVYFNYFLDRMRSSFDAGDQALITVAHNEVAGNRLCGGFAVACCAATGPPD